MNVDDNCYVSTLQLQRAAAKITREAVHGVNGQLYNLSFQSGALHALEQLREELRLDESWLRLKIPLVCPACGSNAKECCGY